MQRREINKYMRTYVLAYVTIRTPEDVALKDKYSSFGRT